MLKIVHYPNRILNTVSKPVTIFNEKLKKITDDMFNVMKSENGIGLAANQVGLALRIFIMHVDLEKEPYIFVNPEILLENKYFVQYNEGCLSFPGLIQEKIRNQSVHLKWKNLNGNLQEQIFEGLEAICIQHEHEHINGITFIDHLSPLKKQTIIKKINKGTSYNNPKSH